MTLEQTLAEVAKMEYPEKVDVVESVMTEVQQHPLILRTKPTFEWRRIAGAAIAAAILYVVVNITLIKPYSYDEDDMGSSIARFNDYSAWHPVEEMAMPSLEIFYDENE